jgi:hypothetical protein
MHIASKAPCFCLRTKIQSEAMEQLQTINGLSEWIGRVNRLELMATAEGQAFSFEALSDMTFQPISPSDCKQPKG